jgi:D-lactate dehydrogenase
MKTGVIIANTSRGPLIESVALVEGLKSGKIGGVALDVYEEEDEVFYEDFSNEIIQDDVLSRLCTLPNVLITSHMGFFTKEAMHAIATTTLQNAKDFENGEKLVNVVK